MIVLKPSRDIDSLNEEQNNKNPKKMIKKKYHTFDVKG